MTTLRDLFGGSPTAESEQQPEVRVVDGDTVEVIRGGESQRVRLRGINTTERAYGEGEYSERNAERETAQLNEFIRAGQADGSLQINTDDETDHYGRSLGTIQTSQGDWGELAVKRGRAAITDGTYRGLIQGDNVPEAERVAAAEAFTRQHNARSSIPQPAGRDYSDMSTWDRSVSRGVDQMMAGVHALTDNEQGYEERIGNLSQNPREVENFASADSLGDYGTWLVQLFGEEAPGIALDLGLAATGGGLAVAAGRRAGATTLRKVLGESAGQQVKRGAAGGASLSMLQQSSGEVATDLMGEDDISHGERLAYSLGTGVPMAAVDLLATGRLLGDVGKALGLRSSRPLVDETERLFSAPSFRDRAAKVAGTFGEQGAAEVAQEGIATIGKTLAKEGRLPSLEEWDAFFSDDQAFEAFMSGGVLGGTLSGTAEAAGGLRQYWAKRAIERELTEAEQEARRGQAEQGARAAAFAGEQDPSVDLSQPSRETEFSADIDAEGSTVGLASQYVDATTAEPTADLRAQFGELQAGTRDAMFISSDNSDTLVKSFENELDKDFRKVRTPEGTLFARTDDPRLDEYQATEDPARRDQLRKAMLGYEASKAELGSDALVVAVEDSNGGRVREELTSPDRQREVVQKYRSSHPGFNVVVQSPEEAQQRRMGMSDDVSRRQDGPTQESMDRSRQQRDQAQELQDEQADRMAADERGQTDMSVRSQKRSNKDFLKEKREDPESLRAMSDEDIRYRVERHRREIQDIGATISRQRGHASERQHAAINKLTVGVQALDNELERRGLRSTPDAQPEPPADDEIVDQVTDYTRYVLRDLGVPDEQIDTMDSDAAWKFITESQAEAESEAEIIRESQGRSLESAAEPEVAGPTRNEQMVEYGEPVEQTGTELPSRQKESEASRNRILQQVFGDLETPIENGEDLFYQVQRFIRASGYPELNETLTMLFNTGELSNIGVVLNDPDVSAPGRARIVDGRTEIVLNQERLADLKFQFDGDVAEVLVHELTHAVAYRRLGNRQLGGFDFSSISNNPPPVAAAAEIERIRRRLIQFEQTMGNELSMPERLFINRATKNTDEMLAMGMTNRHVQRALARISAGAGKANVFSRFVGAVKRLLGLDHIPRSELHSMLEAGAQMFGDMRAETGNLTAETGQPTSEAELRKRSRDLGEQRARQETLGRVTADRDAERGEQNQQRRRRATAQRRAEVEAMLAPYQNVERSEWQRVGSLFERVYPDVPVEPVSNPDGTISARIMDPQEARQAREEQLSDDETETEEALQDQLSPWDEHEPAMAEAARYYNGFESREAAEAMLPFARGQYPATKFHVTELGPGRYALFPRRRRFRLLANAEKAADALNEANHITGVRYIAESMPEELGEGFILSRYIEEDNNELFQAQMFESRVLAQGQRRFRKYRAIQEAAEDKEVVKDEVDRIKKEILFFRNSAGRLVPLHTRSITGWGRALDRQNSGSPGSRRLNQQWFNAGIAELNQLGYTIDESQLAQATMPEVGQRRLFDGDINRNYIASIANIARTKNISAVAGEIPQARTRTERFERPDAETQLRAGEIDDEEFQVRRYLEQNPTPFKADEYSTLAEMRKLRDQLLQDDLDRQTEVAESNEEQILLDFADVPTEPVEAEAEPAAEPQDPDSLLRRVMTEIGAEEDARDNVDTMDQFEKGLALYDDEPTDGEGERLGSNREQVRNFRNIRQSMVRRYKKLQKSRLTPDTLEAMHHFQGEISRLDAAMGRWRLGSHGLESLFNRNDPVKNDQGQLVGWEDSGEVTAGEAPFWYLEGGRQPADNVRIYGEAGADIDAVIRAFNERLPGRPNVVVSIGTDAMPDSPVYRGLKEPIARALREAGLQRPNGFVIYDAGSDFAMVVINPNLSATEQQAVLAHELAHIHIESALDRYEREDGGEFGKWMGRVKRQMRNDPNRKTDQIREYLADQLALAAMDVKPAPVNSVTPDTFAGKVKELGQRLRRFVIDALRPILGTVDRDTLVALKELKDRGLFDNTHAGFLSPLAKLGIDYHARTLSAYNPTRLRKLARSIREIGRALAKGSAPIWATADGRLRKLDAILANLFWTPPNTTGTAARNQYFMVRNNRVRELDSQWARIKKQLGELRFANAVKNYQAALTQSALTEDGRVIHRFYQQMHKKFKHDIPTLGKADEVFKPTVYDKEFIQENHDGFIETLEGHGFGKEAAEGLYDMLIREDSFGDSDLGTILEEMDENQRTTAPEAWSTRSRRIKDPGLIAKLRDAGYVVSDFDEVTSHYIHQMARRAAVDKVFGGYENVGLTSNFSPEALNNLRNRFERSGNSVLLATLKATEGKKPAERYNELIQVGQQTGFIKLGGADASVPMWYNPTRKIKDRLQKLRDQDPRQAEEAYNIVKSYFGRVGLDLDPTARKWMSRIQTYQAFTTLAFSTVASLPDLMGPILRSRNLDYMIPAMRDSFKAMMNYKQTMAEGDEFGLGTTRTAQLQIAEMYGQQFQDLASERWSNRLFKWNGQQMWTQMTRSISLDVGRKAIARAIHDIEAGSQKKQAQGRDFLSQLGLTPEEVQAWKSAGEPTAFDVWDGKVEGVTARNAQTIHDALQRFIDESIVRPNAALRPEWASNPAFMLLWQLKSFFYAYGKVVVQPFMQATHQKIQRGEVAAGLAPYLIAVPGLLALSFLGMQLRDGIQKLGSAAVMTPMALLSDDWEEEREQIWGNSYFDRMSSAEYASEVVRRTGVFGPWELLMGLGDDRPVTDRAAGVLGPAPQQAVQFMGTAKDLAVDAVGAFFGREAQVEWESSLMRAMPGISQLSSFKGAVYNQSE